MPDGGTTRDLWGERARPRPRQLLFDVLAAGALHAARARPLPSSSPRRRSSAPSRWGWPSPYAACRGRLMVVLAAATGVCQLGRRGAGAARGPGLRGRVLRPRRASAVARSVASGWWPRSVPRWCWPSMVGLDDGRCGERASRRLRRRRLGRPGGPGRRWRLGGRLRALAEPGPHHRPGAGRAGAGADPDRRRHARPGRPHLGRGRGPGGRRALRARERRRATGKAAEALEVIAETARGSIADLRDLLAELRYRAARRPRPAAAPARRCVERMRASGMDVRLVEHGEPSGVRGCSPWPPSGCSPSRSPTPSSTATWATPSRSRRTGATATVWSCATGSAARAGRSAPATAWPGCGSGWTWPAAPSRPARPTASGPCAPTLPEPVA